MSKLAVILAGLFLVAPLAAAEKTPLRIELAKEVTVEGDGIQLGSLAEITGGSDELAAKARALPLGRCPQAKETITIDRATILARLACNNVDTSAVEFAGADKTAVRRKEKSFSADEMLKAAEAYLDKNLPAPSGRKWMPAKPPEALTLAENSATTLVCAPAKNSAKDAPILKLSAMAGEKELASTTIAFRLGYMTVQVTAAKEIAAGGTLTPENTKVASVASDKPPAAELLQPYGQKVKEAVAAGAVIKPEMLDKPPAAAVAIKRDEAVVMRIKGSGFVVTAMGQAMQDGKTGELIKVRNVDSKRVIAARVMPDGTVEPVFEEPGK